MTPYTVLASATATHITTKPQLLARSRELEAQALAHHPGQVAACLQDSRFLTRSTLAVYRQLAPVRLFARGLQSWLGEGVEGVALSDDDPLVDEWVLVFPSLHSPVVLAATDIDADGWTWGQSRDPEVVAACAELLGITTA